LGENKMKTNGISAVTLFVSDMKKSIEFYSKIPGFRLVCGGATNDFTTFEIGISKRTYLNLELKTDTKKSDFGRVIFYTDDVNELYSYMTNDSDFSKLATFENEPTTADWGERFFHIRDPDNYQLSFAMPITTKGEEYLEEDLIRKKKQRYNQVYKRRYREK